MWQPRPQPVRESLASSGEASATNARLETHRVKDKYKLQQTFSVNPVYLRHANSGAATDFMVSGQEWAAWGPLIAASDPPGSPVCQLPPVRKQQTVSPPHHIATVYLWFPAVPKDIKLSFS